MLCHTKILILRGKGDSYENNGYFVVWKAGIQVMNQIYGIVGQKGVGKDTFANFVKENNNNFTVIKFADDLKLLTNQIFGFSIEAMESQVEKEKIFSNPLAMDNYLAGMQQLTGLPLQNKNIFAKSLREILQYFGSEYVRSVCPAYWIDRAVSKINRLKTKILVTDCRFINEANVLRKLGAKIIKINRLDNTVRSDRHVSELELEKIDSDLVLGTVFNKFVLQKRVAYLLAYNHYDVVWKYSYNKLKPILDNYVNGASLRDCARQLGIHEGNCGKFFTAMLNYYGIKQRNYHNLITHKFENNSELKKCSMCKNWLKLEYFDYSNKAIDLLNNACKSCGANRKRKQYYTFDQTLRQTWKRAKSSAKVRNLHFDLLVEDLQKIYLLQNKKCFYSGVEMGFNSGKTNKISIDRVDSTKGYTVENVVLCCKVINVMKSNLNIEEFIQWVNRIVDNGFKWDNLKTDQQSVSQCVDVIKNNFLKSGD